MINNPWNREKKRIIFEFDNRILTMLVVSALKTTSHCESIRICERPAIRKVVKKNSEIPKLKKVTNMDVSLAKLKIALVSGYFYQSFMSDVSSEN